MHRLNLIVCNFTIFAVVGCQLTSACLASEEKTISESKPNVVWLISEDNSKHYLKLFDEGGIETPQIEQLAKHGIQFDRAFSNAPVCSVARTTLITSCFAPRIGTQFHRAEKRVPMPEYVRMFPAALRDAGYYTTNNAKKDYNALEGQGVWDASNKKATWKKREKGQPFFHVQTFQRSHEGSLHFPARQMKTKPANTILSSVFVNPKHPKTMLFQYTGARYRESIAQIDRQIGSVIEKLEEDGLLEDTFVFYFSDHGGVLPGSKGYLYETGLHVPLVVRVPENHQHLVGKNWRMGMRTNKFVSFVDFGATVLSLAGVAQIERTDGETFLNPDEDFEPSVETRNSTIGYADRFDEKYDLVRSLRVGKYKYIRNFQPLRFDGLQNNYRYQNAAFRQWRTLFKNGKLNPIQSQFFLPKPLEALYDVHSDPYETRNLAGEPAMQTKLLELRARLMKELKAMPDLGFYPESFLVERAFDNPTQFGKQHQSTISDMIDVANLCLADDTATRRKLAESLRSENPWVRYWAIQSCVSLGQSAHEFTSQIKTIADKDDEPLNRIAAAEFLGTATEKDVQPIFTAVFGQRLSAVEASMVLNSVVLLNDGYDQEVELQEEWFSHLKLGKKSNVQRRLDYLMANQKLP